MPDPVVASAEAAPDATAIVDVETGAAWSYATYDAAVDEAAGRLAGLGLGQGDRVAILSETRPAVATVVFACWRLGAVAVPLNARLTPTELRQQLDRVDPSCLLVATPQQSLAGDVDAGCPAFGIGDDHAQEHRIESLAETPVAAVDAPELDPSTDVAYLFTSGTTGTPKAVRLTAGNFRAAAAAHRERFGVDPADRWLCPLSTYHMGGLAVLVRSASYGTTAVLQRTDEGFDAGRTRAALADHDCTAASLVPVQLRRLLDDDPLPAGLRFVLTGGAPTPPALVERAHRRGVPVCPTYGMTETTSQVATPTPAEAAAHPDSVGTPLDGVAVTLLDEDGRPVDAGAIGEIVVDGPTVTPGYLAVATGETPGTGPTAAAEPDTGGRFDDDGFHTGDVGRVDDEGRLYVLNRREDRILTGGENVHPGEVGDVLSSHPAVSAVAVLGMPHDEWGEQVTALVVTEPGRDLAADDLRGYARERLAAYKVPMTVGFTDALPRTASGTVDRQAARDELRRVTDL